VKAYCDHQDALSLKLQNELQQSEQYKQYCTDEQLWTHYEYMEVFDRLAQFVCNRYPLNSKARKLGPMNSLNDLDIPTKQGQQPVKINIDTVSEHEAIFLPTHSISIRCRFRLQQGWCRIALTKVAMIFLVSFIEPSGSL
jgi:hypothetical protein